MGQFFEGEIIEVYKNYGVISSNIRGNKVQLYFLVTPEMFKHGEFILTKKVRYKKRPIELRKSDVLVAYALKSLKNEERFIVPPKDDFTQNFFEKGYYHGLFQSMDIDREIEFPILNNLIETDKKTKLFFLKWILYTEAVIKDNITKLTIELDENNIYDLLSNHKKTKNITLDRFKSIKNEYIFKPEFNLLILRQNESDPNDTKVVGCPISLFLESLTLTELGEVLNVLIDSDILPQNYSEYKCLYYIKSSFMELSFIRNRAAHGNPLIPHILDDNFNPSYMYEMASAFPDWNVKTNIEQWELFNFIRFTMKSLAKQGVSYIQAGSPMLSALYFTKSLMVNPAKRSFFMFFYVVMVIFEYSYNKNKREFWQEAMIVINHFSSYKKVENIFDKFPSTDNSIKVRLSRIIYPLVSYEFQGSDNFKELLEISFEIRNK